MNITNLLKDTKKQKQINLNLVINIYIYVYIVWIYKWININSIPVLMGI